MKKLVALLLTLCLLACVAALAEKPIAQYGGGAQNAASDWYPNDWEPNGDGTHSQRSVRAPYAVCTQPCSFEEASYGNTSVSGCSVCGDFYVTINGQMDHIKVPLCRNRSLAVSNLYDAKKAAAAGVTAAHMITGTYVDGSDFDANKNKRFQGSEAKNGKKYYFLTTGQYMVRVLALPSDSDLKYVVTTNHEIAGVTYDAEGPYSFMLPLDGRNLTMYKAYFGGVNEIKAETRVVSAGFYLKPYASQNAFGMFVFAK